MLDVVRRLDGDAVAADEAGHAAHDLDAAQQRPDAVAQTADDAVLPPLGGREVDVDLTDEPGARRHPMACPFEVVGQRDQRLRRDAPDVEARAAEPLRLDEHDVASELDRTGRRRVAAGTAADDEDVDGPGDLTGDHQLTVEEEAERRLQAPADRHPEGDDVAAVDDAVVGGQVHDEDPAGDDPVVGVELGAAPGGSEPGDADLGTVHQRRAEPSSEHTVVGDGERRRRPARPGSAGVPGCLAEAAELGGDVEDGALVGVADHRQHETVGRVDGDADVAVRVQDDLPRGDVDAGVEHRVFDESEGGGLDEEGRHRHRTPREPPLV